MQTRIREGLQEIAEISELNDIKEHKSEMSYLQQDRLFEHLAALYQDTISKLPYRIKIHGKRENLENERVANRIRALLLGGIRSRCFMVPTWWTPLAPCLLSQAST